jgi:type IV pilus assembly protein PilA
MIQIINRTKKDRGFTIVELLVVIVVIGILAAITIISYTGVTARAKTAQAASNAAAAQSVAEAMNADNSNYPLTAASFQTGSTSTRLPSGMSVIVGLPGVAGAFTGTEPLSSGTGQTTVAYSCSGGTSSAGSCVAPTGGRIEYWDYNTGARSTTVVYLGAATSGTTFYAPGS